MGIFSTGSIVQLMTLLIYVGFMGVTLYVAILLCNFLKEGTKAFKIYNEKNM